MKHTTCIITETAPLAPSVYRMVLSGDTSSITRPGQFVNIALDGLYLRRPISVCDWDDSTLTLIYKVVGKGTEQLSHMVPGDALDCLAGLGNGYDVSACPDNPVLAGGGVGVPPLYGLAKRLIAAGKRPTVALGFNTAEEIFYDMQFAALGVPVSVATVDGTAGVRGFVTNLIPEGAYVCACGPEPMLRAVYGRAASGQFSFEARMGCGFGACMGCTCETVNGYKRICKDGPVLNYDEILWKDDKPEFQERT